MLELLRTLIRVALEPQGSEVAREATAALEAAPGAQWRKALQTLDLHFVLPLVSHGLTRHGLFESVPRDCRSGLEIAYRNTHLLNGLRFHALARAIRALEAEGVRAVVWKGVVLADGFYPDPGTRPMCDIDLAIQPDERASAARAFTAAGFTAHPDHTADADQFTDERGVVFDVHHRTRLFEGHDPEKLVREIKPLTIKLDTLRVLEPNAMLALLAFHLEGHRPDSGYLLRWLIDMHFVAQGWGSELDLVRISELLPDSSLALLHRVLGFFEVEFGQSTPASCRDDRAAPGALTLEEVLRTRRLAPWGLPRPRGWARLGASFFRDPATWRGPRPELSDLVSWPLDGIRERRLG
jgi:hypothetical protein